MYYLDILKTLIDLAVLNTKNDPSSLKGLLSQILIFILQKRGSADPALDKGVTEIFMSLMKFIDKKKLFMVNQLIIEHLFDSRRLRENFYTDEYLLSRTVLCLKLVNAGIVRADRSRYLQMADKISQEERVTYMKLWTVVILDYPKLIGTKEDKKIVYTIAISSPPMIEMSQRYFTNTILSFENF